LLFRTYAVHWLNQAFRSYLYNFGHTVRVPVYLQKAMKHVNQAIERLGDPKASVEAIARESQLGENLVASAMAAARSARSLDTPLGDDDDGTSLRDMLRLPTDGGPYSVELEDHTLEDSIGEALGRLSERERYVISLRYGIGQEREHTLAEVAGKLGVSLERVRQIQVRAITKMRTPKLRRSVDPFLN
jgi:RNA polymerase primary sigma factor